MAKTRRGKGLLKVPKHGRGTCPLCEKTGLKLLYDVKKGDETLKVCKRCQSK